MSAKIIIDIGECPDGNVRSDSMAEVQGATKLEKNTTVCVLLAVGRGLANFGIEQENADFVRLASDFVRAAHNLYADMKDAKDGKDMKDGGEG